MNRTVKVRRTLAFIAIPDLFETFSGGRSIEDNEE
jgi:hypothetical protein